MVVRSRRPIRRYGRSSPSSIIRPSCGRPVVAIDAAHNNFHTASGRYRPFANLLQADGLTFTSTSAPISQAFLRRIDLLVIANAMGPEGKEDMDPFLIDEKLGLVDWVRGGGRLLLIADHAPFGAAAQDLASRFGVEMHLRYARDDQNHDGWDNERTLVLESQRIAPIQCHQRWIVAIGTGSKGAWPLQANPYRVPWIAREYCRFRPVPTIGSRAKSAIPRAGIRWHWPVRLAGDASWFSVKPPCSARRSIRSATNLE